MPPFTKATLSFHGKKMCPHITEKCWGREICADVAVARPSRCRASHVQIVSHQQKRAAWFSRCPRCSSDIRALGLGRCRARAERGATEHACLCSRGLYTPPPPHPASPHPCLQEGAAKTAPCSLPGKDGSGVFHQGPGADRPRRYLKWFLLASCCRYTESYSR